MTPSILLADLYRRGVALSVKGDRIGVQAPEGVLTPAVRGALEVHKLQLLELVALASEYRILLRDGFALLLRPGGPSAEECEVFLDEQARVTDDLSPDLARTVYEMTAREWGEETGVFPSADEARDGPEGEDAAA